MDIFLNARMRIESNISILHSIWEGNNVFKLWNIMIRSEIIEAK